MNHKLKEQIIKSGNNLHLDVARKLGKEGWLADVSSYYVDDISTAPREIDIIAKMQIDIAGINRSYQDMMGKFYVYLLIECKYFNNAIAFRMLENDKIESIEAIVCANLPKNSFLEQDYYAFPNHHYFNNKIAKLHDVAEKKENNNVFSAITQPIKSLIFQKDESREKALYYPVVIYRGIEGIYGIENIDNNNLDDAVQMKHMIYGVNYAYRRPVDGKTLKQMFYVDFVHESELDNYLKLIESEVEEVRNTMFFLLKNKKLVNR
jgi:hypothetical protein